MAVAIPYEYECTLDELTLDRAATLAPPEFAPAWTWFQTMQGRIIPRLPRGADSPSDVPIKLAAQRGIHTPGVDSLSNGWKNGRRYALTIYSSTGKRYADKSVVSRHDGTWLFDYRAQETEEGREKKWDQNQPLINCLEDGLPVGVLIGQPRGGYLVLGLAFVERYNSQTGFFTLHGPVDSITEQKHLFRSSLDAALSESDKQRLKELKELGFDDGDERIQSFKRAVRRERQAQFRDAVYGAYDGRCAACGTGINEVLQAAHIDDFRGKKSQIVQNGILLRADIHLLYDANLLGIEPSSHRIVLATSVDMSPYDYLADKQLYLPKDSALWPDDDLLDIHYKRFCAQEAAAA